MNRDEQRIKIAEEFPNTFEWHDDGACWWYDSEELEWRPGCPTYSLDVMRELEKQLNEVQMDMFLILLFRILKLPDRLIIQEDDGEGYCRLSGYQDEAVRRMFGATSEQRAEAFLRTLGLWEDDDQK